MDLFIETLTGTAFELKVSPNDTVMSIKSKIQRVEGIPVGQQHLIWQNGELSDHQSLRDCSIPGGATLRLVLGLRGGPINAYRTPATLRLTPLHFAPPSSFERITPPPRSSSNSTTTGSNKHSVTMSSQQAYISNGPVITKSPANSDEVPEQRNIAASPVPGPTNVAGGSSHTTATSGDVLTQPDASSANRKHITFVIFDSGDNLNLVHVIDRNPPSDSPNQLKSIPLEDRTTKAKPVERHPCGSGGFVSAHSLARLQTEPAVNRDSEDDNNQHSQSATVLVGTPSDSSSHQKTLTKLKTPSSIPSVPSSPPSPSAPSSAAAALLAGLLYAAGSRTRDPVSATEEDVLSTSDGERSTFPCSYWLRPSSPEWDYEDIKSLYRSAEDEETGTGVGGLTSDEFPFYDDVDDEEENGADDGGLQGDDDSLADLEDYFLYYHTGDILFGPSPRNSLLRDSLLTGVESVVSGCRGGTRTSERVSTARREECSHLAEKVKQLKAQLVQARENRLQRRNKATGGATTSSVKTATEMKKEQDTNNSLSEHEKMTSGHASSPTATSTKVASPILPKLSAPPATPYLRSSRHSLQRPYTSSVDLSPRLATVGAGDRCPDNTGVRTPSVRRSFDLLRPRGTAPPSISKVSNNLSVAPAPATSLLRPPSTTVTVSRKPSGVSCFTRTQADSSTTATRHRRFGTVQPPDISRIGDSIFPPLFPAKQTPTGTEAGGGRLPRSLSVSKVTSRETTESSRKNSPTDASKKELRLPLLSPGHVSLQSQSLPKGSQRQSTSRAANDPVATRSRYDMSEPPTNRKPTQPKANRCASCNRKTGLANSYTCRCGNNFCSRHRYAELHSCPYDYKAEARRCLRESNPVITATKLPKI